MSERLKLAFYCALFAALCVAIYFVTRFGIWLWRF